MIAQKNFNAKDKGLGSLTYDISSIIKPLFIQITYQQAFYLKKASDY